MRVGYGISGTNILPIGRGVSVGGGGGEVCTPVDQIDGNVAPGATFTHPADGVVAWTLEALPESGVARIMLRHVDDDNTYHVWVSNTGFFGLNEIYQGTNTTRAQITSVVLAGHRIVVMLSDTTITGYSGPPGNLVQRWSYANAINFTSQTNGKRNDTRLPNENGTITDLRSWSLACRTMEGV